MKVTVTGDGGDITLNSPAEALFYGLCWLHEIPVERVRPEEAGTEAHGLWYWPGFRVAVPKVLDVYVEVSDGTDEGIMRPLRGAWRGSLRKTLVVVYREQLYDLREASRPAQFIARLKMIETMRMMP